MKGSKMTKQNPTFEDAIADLKNITMWNFQDHFPTLLAGLQDAANRLRDNERDVKTLASVLASVQTHLASKSNANPT